MADLNELLNSKKVSTFVRKEKSRPWTIDQRTPELDNSNSQLEEVTQADVKPRVKLEQSQNKVEPLEQNDHPAPSVGAFGRTPPTPSIHSEAKAKGAEQTKHKPLAMREQTVSNASLKPLAMREQTVSSRDTIDVFEKDSVSNAYAEALAEPLAMREQTVSNAYADVDFESLVGKEKKLLSFVFKKCQPLGALETPLVTTEELRQLLEVSSERLRNVIYRLSQKGLLEVIAVKNGRSGWRKFRLTKELFQKLCFDPSVSNTLAMREQTVSIASPKAYAEALAGVSSSSSYELDKDLKTTTDQPELQKDNSSKLSPEWEQVDYSPLSDIAFTQTHLLQIFQQGKLSVTEVQDSIHFFAFDLKRNGKGKEIKGHPLNFFMGILRKCIPYAPPENFESSADEARRKTREFKERKQRERQVEEQQLLNLEFSEWRSGLSENELLKLLPEFARKAGPIQDSALKMHFKNEVWPERTQDLLGLEKFNHTDIGKQLDQALKKGSTT